MICTCSKRPDPTLWLSYDSWHCPDCGARWVTEWMEFKEWAKLDVDIEESPR